MGLKNAVRALKRGIALMNGDESGVELILAALQCLPNGQLGATFGSKFSRVHSRNVVKKLHIAAEDGRKEVSSISDPERLDSGILQCAFLIGGCAIGGGFLALPNTTAALGFAPSVVVLVVCSAFLATQALLFATVTAGVYKEGNRRPISVLSVARNTLGPRAAAGISICFAALLTATLSAQIAKGGDLVVELLAALGAADLSSLRVVGCLAYAIPCAALSLSGRNALVTSVAAVLTAGMLLAFGALLGAAGPKISWSALALQPEAQWGAAFSPMVVGVCLQLLTYLEAVPAVCMQLQGDLPRIRAAILIGGSIPLVMCISWNAVALGQTNVSLHRDVLQLLGASTVKHQVTALAWFASSTTTIGCFLALFQLFCDGLHVLPMPVGGGCPAAHHNQHHEITSPVGLTETEQTTHHGKATSAGLHPRNYGSGELRIWLARTTTFCLPVSVALSGPNVFYAATAFAGEYPVVILWGIFPPLMFWAQRYGIQKSPLWPPDFARVGLAGLVTLSAVFLMVCAVHDMGPILASTLAAFRILPNHT
ncbi:hypothetical protein CYMTET_43985 [Cymbomonas tetramitiformis]|uniref:Uncharacterized protein n=1 Tax=Cymbomonas tetramitiformis TaxID=36881 RepID=A0AAE0C359_9CHLO|nr:hypothetical protein CYMTET_43985 [Cymbomonas tetramitiformis]